MRPIDASKIQAHATLLVVKKIKHFLVPAAKYKDLQSLLSVSKVFNDEANQNRLSSLTWKGGKYDADCLRKSHYGKSEPRQRKV